jgi:hypothetical protein
VILATLLPLCFVFPARAEGQPLATGWSHTYVEVVGVDSIQQTSDQGFIVTGTSFGAWVMKANFAGQPEWERVYTATVYQNAYGMLSLQTSDHGYLVMGGVSSSTGKVPWLIKLDNRGLVQWSRIYGGHTEDRFSWVQQTSDNGYIVAGNTGPINGHLFNGWVLKLSSEGSITWQEAFIGEDIHSIEQTADGGYVVSGTVGVSIEAFAWVFKLNTNGDVVWQKGFAATAYNAAYSVHQTNDGGYILAAEAMTLSSIGYYLYSHALLIKLDGDGNITWQRLYGDGVNFTTPYSVEQTRDGGFIVSGRSNGPFLLRLDANGNLVWQKIYGGENDFFSQSLETRDGGFVVGGSFASNCCGYLAWVLKANSNGSVRGCSTDTDANATLTDSFVRTVSTMPTGVLTHATATTIDVTVNIYPSALQLQCRAS